MAKSASDYARGKRGFGVHSTPTSPKTLTDYFIPAFMGLGYGVKAGGDILSGLQTEATAKFNTKQIEQDIRSLGVTKDFSMAAFRRQAKELQSQQEAAVATSGFAMDGSMYNVLIDSASQMALEGVLKEREFALKESQLRAEKRLSKKAAKAKTMSHYLSGVGTLSAGVMSFLER